jgi:hypothetical protein
MRIIAVRMASAASFGRIGPGGTVVGATLDATFFAFRHWTRIGNAAATKAAPTGSTAWLERTFIKAYNFGTN